MTPDDKRRLAEIRRDCNMTEFPGTDVAADCVFLLRLLDEAIAERNAIYEAAGNHEKQAKEAEVERDAAINELSLWAADKVMLDLQAERDRYMRERDAAMAALGEIAVMDGHALFAENARNVVNLELAAHSAATKQADPVEKAGSDG